MFDGRAAMLLFFVISGFVLGRQIGAAPILTPAAWSAFLVRRVFRLVPAMWLAILLAYVIAQWRGIPSGVNLGMFGKTLILQDLSLMVPLWSLNVEIGCSLVFPLLYAFGRRFGLFCNLGILLVLAALIYRTHRPWTSELNLLAIWYFSKLGSWRGHGALHCGSEWE